MAKETPITFRVTVVVPVRQTVSFDFVYYKHFKPSLEPVFNELLSFSLADFGFTAYEARNFHCGLRKKSKKRKLRHRFEAKRIHWPCVELEWSADLTLRKFPGQQLNGKKAKFKERVSLAVSKATDQFASTVMALLVASNIASPGVITTYELETWVDDKFFTTGNSELLHLISEAVEFAHKNSWPNIETLPLKDVWQWMRSLEPLSQNVGDTALSRGLNAFTHLLCRKWGSASQLADLMWAMIGLEAIYGRGTTDLTNQLVEKSGVLLGKRNGFEKTVKDMYRFRSLFIHGKAKFPNALFWDEHPSDKQVEKASMLASAVLVATLQQFARRGWKNLSFSTVVYDPPREEYSN